MGLIADAVLAAGGAAIGGIPEFLASYKSSYVDTWVGLPIKP
ncbi:hypothetical protein [Leptodesmis sichuanensis]|nr:hypothetical protein [Leptodesmis sichuanensis]